MKKINILLYIVVASLLFVSCNDTPDSKDNSSFTSDDVYTSEELTDAAVMGIVVSMGETNSYRSRFLPYYGSNTDIEFFNSSDTRNDKSDLAVYATTANNSEMNTTNNAWGKMYEGIERANLAIEGLRSAGNALPETLFGHFLAEALTLRAVLYLDLTRAWGDVPARFESVKTNTINLPKSDRDVIYKQMISDLEEAAILSTWPNTNKYTQNVGRINRTFIKALRAKYCLVAGGYAQRPDSESPRLSSDPELDRTKMYQLAETELMELYNNPQLAGTIDSSFEGIFKKLCEENTTPGQESLWEIPFSNNRGRMAYTYGIRHQSVDQYTGLAAGGSVGPTPNFFYDYDESDLRRDVTCIPYKWSKTNPAVQVISEIKTWAFGKYRFEWMTRRVTSSSDDGLKKQYMRFTEIYLMLAEIKNELYGPTQAAPFLKAIRNRAFEAADRPEKVEDYVAALNTKEKMFEAIVDEHAFEFAGEMVRKEALIRWNLLGTKMKETKEKLYNLRSQTGEYVGVPTKVYYKNVPAYTGDPYNEKIEIYGLNRGETDNVAADYTGSTDWITEKKLTDARIESLFENDPDKHQFWPIWEVFIDASSGVLKNDYGY